MSKKSKFIKVIEILLDENENIVDLVGEDYNDFMDYWNAFKSETEVEKPMFTDNGKLILQFMKDNNKSGKAKDIAEELFISARTVSGAMRKLVSDGFVEKLGQNPIIYSLTEKGKNVEII